MRSEQWIRTQKRRVRKKYRKVGNVYFSPKEYRYFRHGKYWGDLVKAVEKIAKGFQEMMAVLNESVKVFSEAYTEDCEGE